MSRVDTSIGIYNYPVATTTATTQTALLAPTASGIYPSLPSPSIPLSTTTFPAGLWIGVPADIAGGEFDGHPFEVKVAGKLTTTATTSLTVALYNATAASFAGGPGATSYTLATLGTGCTKVAGNGTPSAVGTGGASVNFVLSVQFIWDSVSKNLSTLANTLYINGSLVTTTPANVTALGQADLNFIPAFTYSATNSPVLTLTEFVINRI